MALASQYETFRSTSNPDCLATDAVLHYVTTLKTHTERTVILKHLATQAKQLKKKKEEVLSSMESQSALFQEVLTTLEFVSSGGAYLPGLDDNLIADQEVTLPILHAVHFSASGTIEQIRLHWDQASLLKSIGVIGARGGNWPITDGKDQGKLIAKSAAGSRSSLEETSKQMGGVTISSRPTKKVNPTNDPHTSLDLFAPRHEQEAEEEEARGSTVYPPMVPRGTLKPQERPWNELFVGSASNQGTPTGKGPESPTKENVAPKVGAGKNYGPNRLFDTQDEDPSGRESPSKGFIKTNAAKYQHFELFDGHNEPAPPPSEPRPRTKHQSQWDFSDFVTPAKVIRTRGQSQGAHHFSFDDDTLTDSPRKQPVHKPRRDAASQFELQDDGGDPDDDPARHHGATRGHGHNRNQSTLWASQTDDGGPDAAGTRSFTQTTAVSNTDRHKDFDPHFSMTDDAGGNAGQEATPRGASGVGASIKNRHKDFDAHWAIDDEHPGATDEEHDASHGDAGLTKNRARVLQSLSSQWEASDDSQPTGVPTSAAEARVLGRAGGKENTGIKTGGDGMGGRKGSARQWGFGDDVDMTPVRPAAKGGRHAPGGQRAAPFWEDTES